MGAPTRETLLRLSPEWTWGLEGRTLVLRRAIDGAEIRFTGRGKGTIAAALERLRRPLLGRALEAELAPLGGEERAALMEALREHAVVRLHPSTKPPRIRGAGSLRAAISALVADGGFRLPPLVVADRWTRRAAATARPREVAVLVCRGDIVASLASARPCPRCAWLRRLGRTEQEGDEQTLLMKTRSPAKGPDDIGPLAASLLIALEARPLVPGEALVARRREGIARSALLEHPDCEVCARRRPRSPASAMRALLSALASTEPAKVAPGSREAFTDPHLGPLIVCSETERRSLRRSGETFLWGSIRLTRVLNAQARSVSTLGGVYASHPDPAYCRLIALSEGVERLAAMGARPSVWGRAARLPGAVPVRSLWPSVDVAASIRRRAFCYAVNLVTRRPCLLPFESVVVGLPPALYPEAARHEPFYSGTASHATLAQAVIHATLEVLSRDAYMITWYRRRAVRRLSWPERPSDLARTRGRYLRARGMELELFDITLDGPLPVLLLRMTAKRPRGNWPGGGAMLAAGIGFDAMAALEQALKLAYGQFVSLALMPSPEKDPLDPDAVRRMSTTVRYWPLFARYLDPRNRAAHAFFGQSAARFEDVAPVTMGGDPPYPPAQPVNLSEAGARISRLRSWFEERSLPWIVTRLTDGPAARAGFEVVKVVVPGLVPVAAARDEAPLTLPRMRHPWPDATSAHPNPDPHPLY